MNAVMVRNAEVMRNIVLVFSDESGKGLVGIHLTSGRKRYTLVNGMTRFFALVMRLILMQSSKKGNKSLLHQIEHVFGSSSLCICIKCWFVYLVTFWYLTPEAIESSLSAHKMLTFNVGCLFLI